MSRNFQSYDQILIPLCTIFLRCNCTTNYFMVDISLIHWRIMRTGVERRHTVVVWRRQPLNNHRLDYHRRLPKVIRPRVRAHPVPPLYQMAPLTRIRNRTFTRKSSSPKARARMSTSWIKQFETIHGLNPYKLILSESHFSVRVNNLTVAMQVESLLSFFSFFLMNIYAGSFLF